ncbi:hypothetical protein D9M73_214200 [compost metagenome]
MVAAVVPLVGQRLRQLDVLVDLVDGHALVGLVQGLVVEVAVQVALLLQRADDVVMAPARPVVRGDHHLGLVAEAVQHFVDVFAPAQRVAGLGATQGVEVVQRAGHVLGNQQHLLLRQPDVHFRRRFGARGVLEGEGHAIQFDIFQRALDQAGGRQ